MKGVDYMSSYHPDTSDPPEFKKYHTFARMPAAVSCWFPSGDKNHPIILMFKFKEPDGDIVTIRDIYSQYCEQNFYFASAIVEFKCQILYQNRKREIVLFYYPRDLNWEITFVN